jgi:hypothetical protein
MIFTVDSLSDVVRSELNETQTTIISAAEMLRAINDTQLHIATRAYCIEKEASMVTTSGRNRIKFNGIRVNYIEYLGIDSPIVFSSDFTDLSVTWNLTAGSAGTNLGLQRILPTNIGHTSLKTTTPEKWFNWGKYVIIEPVPDDRYILKLYYADYPAELTLTTEELEVPHEFQQCSISLVLSLLSMKLRRWGDSMGYYNKYISELQVAKAQYVNKYPDIRASLLIPDTVRKVSNERV